MMREDDVALLQSVSSAYHPNIESSREEYFAKKKEEQQRMLEMKAREYYNNDWIVAKKNGTSRPPVQRRRSDRRRYEACPLVHDGSDRWGYEVKVSKGRSSGPGKVSTFAAEKESRRNAAGLSDSSWKNHQHLVPPSLSPWDRRRRRAAIHNALYSTQSPQPLIRSEKHRRRAPNKYSDAQERKNNSLCFSQPAIKIQKIIQINQSCSEIKE